MKNMKEILGMLIFTFLVTCALVSAQTQTPTALILNYDQMIVPTDLEPGDIKPLYVVIQNTGGLPAREVSVTLPTSGGLSTEGSDGGSITSGGKFFLGTINPGGSARVVSSIRAADDARIGTHYLSLYLTYDESRYDADANLHTEKETSKWIIPVDVQSGSLLEIGDYKLNVAELKSGETFLLSLDLKNNGEGDAIDVVAFLGMPKDGSATNNAINAELASAFTVLGTVEKKLGTISRNKAGSMNMQIYIDDETESKAYTLPITAEYEDKSGAEHTDIFYLGIYLSGDRKLTITNFKSDPPEIHSDDEDVEFTGYIENQGSGQVKSVKVTFQPNYPLKNARSFIQTKEVGTVKGGASTSFTFYADVAEDIRPQATNVTFVLDYEVNSQPFHDVIVHTVAILEHPHFEVSIDAPPTAPSQRGIAKIELSNDGSKCEDVTIIILEKRDQPFDFVDKSAYVGDIDGGESGVASITYTVEDKAPPQPHIVPIEIRCTKDDDVLVFSKSMRLEVGASAGGGNSTLIIVIVVVGVIALSFFKKREKKIEQVKEK